MMTRAYLLGAASAAALACAPTVQSFAASTITGGGSTSTQYDYIAEFSVYNAKTSGAQFGTYYGSGATGQTAFLLDDLSCDINKVNGNNGGNCSGPEGGAGNTVDYASSDSVLTSSQISGWASFQFGQVAAGDLIQIPSMGTGLSIPVENAAITANGKLIIQDADICGVFSGKITDFSQLSVNKGGTKPTPGAITVVYRNDSAAATFLLTNHLSAVCTNSNSDITFTATTTFQSLFPNSTPPANFVGEKGASGMSGELVTLTSALGYISPDWTSINPNSNAPSHTLLVAAVLNGKTAELPTTKNITAALARPKLGQNLTPPANKTEGANPALWVPVIQTVSAGYPIVGYSTFDFAQCYADATVAAGIIAFMTDHYTVSQYLTIENNNGLVAIANSGASKFLAVVKQHILANKNTKPAWNEDIQDKTACKGLVGR